ncbi:Hypothetical predicted protein [Drosophila guanche]|uniref:Uncharacterized protein n=1 Tax=Drosophila guanche TaxID=7266 RepID=A0A3B0JMS2_DROGU|nr:Hypothetical predicted protein [Drosophila guanche]
MCDIAMANRYFGTQCQDGSGSSNHQKNAPNLKPPTVQTPERANILIACLWGLQKSLKASSRSCVEKSLIRIWGLHFNILHKC